MTSVVFFHCVTELCAGSKGKQQEIKRGKALKGHEIDHAFWVVPQRGPLFGGIMGSFDPQHHFFGGSMDYGVKGFWSQELEILMNAVRLIPSPNNDLFTEVNNGFTNAFVVFEKRNLFNFEERRVKFQVLVLAFSALQVVRERQGELTVYEGGKEKEKGEAFKLIIKLLDMASKARNNGGVYDFGWTQKVNIFLRTGVDENLPKPGYVYEPYPVPGFSTTMVMLRAILEFHLDTLKKSSKEVDKANKETLESWFKAIGKYTEALGDASFKIYPKSRTHIATAKSIPALVSRNLGDFFKWIKGTKPGSSANFNENDEKGKQNKAIDRYTNLIKKGITAAAARNIVCRFRATLLETVKANIDKIIIWIGNGAEQEDGKQSLNDVGLNECTTLPRYSTAADFVGKVEKEVAKAVLAVEAAKTADTNIHKANVSGSRLKQFVGWWFGSEGKYKKAEELLAISIATAEEALAEKKPDIQMVKLKGNVEEAVKAAKESLRFAVSVASAEVAAVLYGNSGGLGPLVKSYFGGKSEENVATQLELSTLLQRIIDELNTNPGSVIQVLEILKEITDKGDGDVGENVEPYKAILRDWLDESRPKDKDSSGAENIRRKIENFVEKILNPTVAPPVPAAVADGSIKQEDGRAPTIDANGAQEAVLNRGQDGAPVKKAVEDLKKDPIIQTLGISDFSALETVSEDVLKQTTKEFYEAEKEVQERLSGLVGDKLPDQLKDVAGKIKQIFDQHGKGEHERGIDGKAQGIIKEILTKRAEQLRKSIESIQTSLSANDVKLTKEKINEAINIIDLIPKRVSEYSSGFEHLKNLINGGSSSSVVEDITNPSQTANSARLIDSYAEFISGVNEKLQNYFNGLQFGDNNESSALKKVLLEARKQVEEMLQVSDTSVRTSVKHDKTTEHKDHETQKSLGDAAVKIFDEKREQLTGLIDKFIAWLDSSDTAKSEASVAFDNLTKGHENSNSQDYGTKRLVDMLKAKKNYLETQPLADRGKAGDDAPEEQVQAYLALFAWPKDDGNLDNWCAEGRNLITKKFAENSKGEHGSVNENFTKRKEKLEKLMDQVSEQIKVFLKVERELATATDATTKEELEKRKSEILKSYGIIFKEIGRKKSFKGFTHLIRVISEKKEELIGQIKEMLTADPGSGPVLRPSETNANLKPKLVTIPEGNESVGELESQNSFSHPPAESADQGSQTSSGGAVSAPVGSRSSTSQNKLSPEGIKLAADFTTGVIDKLQGQSSGGREN